MLKPFFTFWVFVCPLWASLPTEMQSLWEKSQNQINEKKYQESIESLNHWLQGSQERSIQSPEAYFNLAVAYSALNLKGESHFYLVKSLLLRDSPARIWKDLNLLSESEAELGIRQPVSEKTSFRLSFLFSHNLRLLVGTLGFWCFVLYLFLGRFKETIQLKFRKVLLGVGFSLWIILITAWSNISSVRPIGVLVSPKQGAVLFSNSNGKGKLLDLPDGVVVQLAEKEADFRKIVFPVAGWIEEKYIRKFQFSGDSGLGVLSLIR